MARDKVKVVMNAFHEGDKPTVGRRRLVGLPFTEALDRLDEDETFCRNAVPYFINGKEIEGNPYECEYVIQKGDVITMNDP